MLISKFFILFFLYFPFLATTHPFYKTMPKEVEHIYDELKAQEQEAINAFKNAYPKVPAHFWEHAHFLEKQMQTWLRDTAESNIKIFDENLYKNYSIQEECQEQIIDCRKINFKIGKFKEEDIAGATTMGPFVVENWETDSSQFLEIPYSIYPHFNFNVKLNYTRQQQLDELEKILEEEKKLNTSNNIDTSLCDINIEQAILNIEKIESVMSLLHHDIKDTIKHELAHITEAHHVKKEYITQIIATYYNQEKTKSDKCKKLFHQYTQTQELIARIFPFLLSSEFAAESLENINMFFKLNQDLNIKEEDFDELHPNTKIIYAWLKKILATLHLANKPTT